MTDNNPLQTTGAMPIGKSPVSPDKRLDFTSSSPTPIFSLEDFYYLDVSYLLPKCYWIVSMYV